MEDVQIHHPVLLEEALEALQIRPDGIYIDGTFGRGGHAEAIIRQLNDQGRLLAIDKDPVAVAVARQKFEDEARFIIERGSFAMLGELAQNHGLLGRVNGVLLDLGVSSPQLDDALRGFSFLKDGPLDMRMDPASGISAAAWLEQVSEKELSQVLRDLGEERYHRRIARAIVSARAERPIETTRQLAEIVAQANPAWEKHKHPATRTFQAIRIYINHELEDIGSCLQQTIRVLAAGGRLVVISFHSLEDRIVKRFMRDQARGKQFPKGLPVQESELERIFKVVGKAIRPTDAEVNRNPRARSAVMRVAERLP